MPKYDFFMYSFVLQIFYNIYILYLGKRILNIKSTLEKWFCLSSVELRVPSDKEED